MTAWLGFIRVRTKPHHFVTASQRQGEERAHVWWNETWLWSILSKMIKGFIAKFETSELIHRDILSWNCLKNSTFLATLAMALKKWWCVYHFGSDWHISKTEMDCCEILHNIHGPLMEKPNEVVGPLNFPFIVQLWVGFEWDVTTANRRIAMTCGTGIHRPLRINHNSFGDSLNNQLIYDFFVADDNFRRQEINDMGSIHLSVYLSVCLSVHPSLCLSDYPAVCLSNMSWMWMWLSSTWVLYKDRR